MEAKIIVTTLREILTVRDVALELRCSVDPRVQRHQWEGEECFQASGHCQWGDAN